MSVEHSFCDDYRLPYEPFPVAEKSAKFVGCTYDNRRESRAREFKFESIIDLGSFYRLFLRHGKKFNDTHEYGKSFYSCSRSTTNVPIEFHFYFFTF